MWIKPIISAVERLQFYKFSASLKCSSKPKFLKANDCIFLKFGISICYTYIEVRFTYISYIHYYDNNANFTSYWKKEFFHRISYPPLRLDLTTSCPHIKSFLSPAPWPTRSSCLSYKVDINDKMTLMIRLNMEQWNV